MSEAYLTWGKVISPTLAPSCLSVHLMGRIKLRNPCDDHSPGTYETKDSHDFDFICGYSFRNHIFPLYTPHILASPPL